MASNINWTRWLQASINNYWKNNTPANAQFLFYEGQPRDSRDLDGTVEIRIDGPDMAEVMKNQWILKVEINVFVSNDIDDKNMYRHSQLLGEVSAVFTDIPIYKCGNGPDDDDSFLGCLVLIQRPGSRDYIETNRFGLIEPSLRIEQSTIEGHYKMELLT